MSLVHFTQRPIATSFLDEIFRNEWPFLTHRNHSVPAVNVQETEKAYVLALAAPGKSKSDFEIELDKEVLTISAVDAQEDTNDLFTRKEFNYSAFKRAFTLPDTVDVSKIKANYIHGILTVELPKRKEALPQPTKRIAID